MLVLSFDVGTKNMGVCELDVEAGTGEMRIGLWDVMSLGPEEHLVDAVMALLRKVVSGCETQDWDAVLIENQMGLHNVRMKTVQTAIHSFFSILHPSVTVEYVSPRKKISLAQCHLGEKVCKVAYREGKKVVVRAAEDVIKRNAGVSHLAQKLCDKRKKDDMCDSLMQALTRCTPAA